ncbi:hypothetical protein CB0940_10121 [Cercospora beticola]|uniref:Uncharacterized protein n=1 Tax=Cercospora beticola TaxID=122368 RepID=A0A2G5HTQ6_CERBT|nr:hypothetical protein CB0940_10121 [Cercospora beticola]PIA95673.1 hypothetical protein CB0940_10121 [Cercospora beticola]WPB06825.1 hypothetical protein RHO25_011485 [Cercospora beticola]CAK1366737.1 unnamed protein product [Cercospora beticola]
MAPHRRRHSVSSTESNASDSSSSTSTSTKEVAAAQRVFASRQALIKTLGETMKGFTEEIGDDFDKQDWELYKALEKYIGRSFRAAGEAGSEIYAAVGRYFKIRSKLLIAEVEHLPGRLSARDSASHKLWTQKCRAEQLLLQILMEKGDEEDFDVALWMFDETDSALYEVIQKAQSVEKGHASAGPSRQTNRQRSSRNYATRHRPAQERLEHLTGYFDSRWPPMDQDAILETPDLVGRESAAPYPWHNLYQPATPSQYLFGTQHRPEQQKNTRKPRKNSAKSKRTARPSTCVPEEVHAGPSSTSPNLPSTPSYCESDGGVPLTDETDLAYGSDGDSDYFPRATKKQETRREPRNKQTGKGKGKASDGLERLAQALSGRPPKRSEGKERLTEAISGRPRKTPKDKFSRQKAAMAYRFGEEIGRALVRDAGLTSGEDV